MNEVTLGGGGFLNAIKALLAFFKVNGDLGEILMVIFQLFFGGKITTDKLKEMLTKLKADMEAESNKNPGFPPLI